MKEYEAGAATLSPSIGLAPGARAALVAGAIVCGVVVLLNVPGNPAIELQHHQAAGMALAHGGMVLVALGLWPIVSRALTAAAAIDGRRLAAWLAVLVVGLAAVMALFAAAAPEYARQLLTREWGVVEPAQFVLYLLVARLCFTLADRWPAGAASRRVYKLGGWLARLSALEEVDYLGVLAGLVRLAGVERSRIGGSYVGALHDALNVAEQYGLFWAAGLTLAAAAVAAAWWVSGGRPATARAMLSWRLAPAGVGALFMALAQFADIVGPDLGGPRGRWLSILMEEPCELLAIVCVSATLVLEVAHNVRGGRARLTRRWDPA